MQKQGLILDATLRQAAGADRREGKLSQSLAVRMARQAYHAGVTISAGTDSETPPEDREPALLDELELLADGVGMPPLQVFRSATLVGAMTIDRAAEMGTIAVGKLANLVFLEKNPLESIKNIRTARFTVKRGIRFHRQ